MSIWVGNSNVDAAGKKAQREALAIGEVTTIGSQCYKKPKTRSLRAV